MAIRQKYEQRREALMTRLEEIATSSDTPDLTSPDLGGGLNTPTDLSAFMRLRHPSDALDEDDDDV